MFIEPYPFTPPYLNPRRSPPLPSPLPQMGGEGAKRIPMFIEPMFIEPMFIEAMFIRPMFMIFVLFFLLHVRNRCNFFYPGLAC